MYSSRPFKTDIEKKGIGWDALKYGNGRLEGAFQYLYRTEKFKRKVVELGTFLEIFRKFNNNYTELLISALTLYFHLESMKDREVEIPFLCYCWQLI